MVSEGFVWHSGDERFISVLCQLVKRQRKGGRNSMNKQLYILTCQRAGFDSKLINIKKRSRRNPSVFGAIRSRTSLANSK